MPPDDVGWWWRVQDAHALQVLVLLGIAVLALTLLARRLHVAPPILLLLGGVPLAFVPWLEGVVLRPEVVLLIFLPALLYWESLTTSLREIRANLRAVMLDAVLLVFATAGAVAVVGHALGLSWPVAWVLGAVLAPTDATAVANFAGRLPRRLMTQLRAESLINDGTALVLFAIAVEVATGEAEFGWGGAVARFGLSYLGGAAVGLLVAWVAARVRRWAHHPLLDNTVSVLTPFTAFLLAEEIHASGVLAVVVAGLAMAQVGPLLIGGQTRMRAQAFWQLTTFLLNGSLFVLIGLQLRGAVEGLESYTVLEAAGYAVLVSATVIGTRLAWMYTVPYLVRVLDRRPRERERRLSARQRLPIAWSGFRGGVSLAAALAVPVVLADGSTFPDRDLILVVTFGVILVTLVVQGLTLPAVLRAVRLPEDHSVGAELRLAQRTATEAALAALDREAARLAAPDTAVDRIRTDLEDRLADLSDPTSPDGSSDDTDDAGDGTDDDTRDRAARRSDRESYRLLREALIADKRTAVVELRDAGLIDDIVLRRVQTRLDAEELRLSSTLEAESE